MKLIILLFSLIFMDPTFKIDFGGEKEGSRWYIINDDVMGGLSRSQGELTENTMIFTGTISLDNNGGFASVRNRFGKYDLSQFEKVRIKYKCNNRDFALILENTEYWWQPYHKYTFTSDSDEWVTAEFNLSDFKEYAVGRFNGDYMNKKDLEKVIRIGFILFDKKEGPFNLEVDYIEFI